MLSEEMGFPHFAQIFPVATVGLAASPPSVPNNFAKNPTVPPLEELE